MRRPILKVMALPGALLAVGTITAAVSLALPKAQASAVPIEDLKLLSETNGMIPLADAPAFRLNVRYRFNVNVNVNYNYRYNVNTRFRYAYNF